jgi:hypothetical protein
VQYYFLAVLNNEKLCVFLLLLPLSSTRVRRKLLSRANKIEISIKEEKAKEKKYSKVFLVN